ncbi:MAG: ankyrin repeat domain-containing protein [Aureliella sp.]
MKIQFTGRVSDFLKIGVASAGRGDLPAVKEILKRKPQWLRRIGSHGRTMLWEASHRGKLEVVQHLIEQGADVNARGSYYTPYFVEVSCRCIASHKRHEAVVDTLMAAGAKYDLHSAAFLDDFAGVKRYLRRSSKAIHRTLPQSVMAEKDDPRGDFYLAENDWATPLCYALRGGSAAMVELLLEQGARVKGLEKYLYEASEMEVGKVRLLLEAGADPTMLPDIHEDEGELFTLARDFGVKPPNEFDHEELVYLCRGDRGGNPDEVRRFLSLGADVNYQDAKGKTALHRAAKAGFLETSRILLENGADPNITDQHGETPVYETARSTIKNTRRVTAVLRLLIEQGADLSHRNLKELTCLDVASRLKLTRRNTIMRILKSS